MLPQRLASARQLVLELGRSLAESGGPRSVTGLGDRLKDLEMDSVADSPLRVQVVLVGTASQDALEALALWLGENSVRTFPAVKRVRLRPPNAGSDLACDLMSLEEAVPRRAGFARPGATVFHIEALETLSSEDVHAISEVALDSPCVLLLTARPPDPGSPLAVACRKAWLHVWVAPESRHTGAFASFLTSLFPESVDLLKACAVLEALDGVQQALALGVAQDLKDVGVQRSLAQQAAARYGGASMIGGRTHETLNEARNNLQRHFAEFERGLGDRLQESLTPLSGTLWTEFVRRTGDLAQLEEDQGQHASVLRLPKGYEEDLTQWLQLRILQLFEADAMALNDLLPIVAAEIEGIVQKSGAVSPSLFFQPITADRFQAFVRGQIIVRTQYRSEAMRRGAFEYFMESRKYLMMLTALMGIFQIAEGARQQMAGISVAVLFFGSIQTYRAVRGERIERLRRELERAKQMIESELRRTLSDVHRKWVQSFSEHLRDIASGVLPQIEGALNQHAARTGQTAHQERERLQRQLQSLDMSERRLQGASRLRESCAMSVARARGELRQALASVEARSRA